MNEQPTPPLCATVTSTPATRKVADRAFTDAFAVTLNPSVPLPVPLFPNVILTQLGSPETDHVHEETVAVMPRVPCIPDAGA